MDNSFIEIMSVVVGLLALGGGTAAIVIWFINCLAYIKDKYRG